MIVGYTSIAKHAIRLMFTIIGSDGKEYGPVASDQIKEWLIQKRVGSDSMVKSSETGAWKKLSECPEFSDLASLPPIIGQGLSATASESLRFGATENPVGVPAKKKTSGCLIILVSLFGLGLVATIINAVFESTRSNPSTGANASEPVVPRTFNESKRRFEESMPMKYKELLALKNEGRFEEADVIVHQFENFERLDYQSMASIAPVIHTASDLARLERIPPNDAVNRASVYSDLSHLHPENKEYANQAARFAADWQRQEVERVENEKKEAEQQRAITERQNKIKSQFSLWDGSHRGLEEIIKKQMNDPDSYKHVETSYSDLGDYILVKTTFRGKNKFGGVVTNWIEAKFTIDGTLIEIVDQGT